MTAQRGKAPPTITCIVVEHHPGVLDALALVLPEEGFDIVGTGRSGAEALVLIRSIPANVVVIDLALPDMTALDVVRAASPASADIGFVVYAAAASRALVDEALAAGIRGVVLKGGPATQLLNAIRTVASGGVYMDARLDPGPGIPRPR